MSWVNIIQCLDEQALARPRHVALRYAGRCYELDWVARAVDSVAAFLAQQGVRPGTTIGLLIHNRRDLLLSQLAVARLGATVVNLSPLQSVRYHYELMTRTRTELLLSDGDVPQANYNEKRLILFPPNLDLAIRSRADSAPNPRQPIARPQAPWMLLVGSGSTGRPKILPLSHEAALARGEIYERALSRQDGDRLACLTPLEQGFGAIRTAMMLCRGGSVALLNLTDHPDPESLRQQGVTILLGGGSHARQFLEMNPKQTGPSLSFLRAFILGGSTVSEDLRQRIITDLTPNLHVNYGTQESGPVAMTRPSDPQRSSSVGKVIQGAELRVVDHHGQPLPAGEIGFIQIRSPGMINHYLDDSDATAKAFVDGWFCPADAGFIDSEGQLIYRGREDHMMIFDGINIYPAEVEDVMSSFAGVVDVSCVPIPSDAYQDFPVCALSFRSGHAASQSDLHQFALDRLGPRRPREFIVLASIPRTPTGKLIRRDLYEQIAACRQSSMRGTEMHAHCPGGQQPPLSQLFKTVEGTHVVPLDHKIGGGTSHSGAYTSSAGSPITAAEIEAFPASCAQSRLWFLHQLKAEQTAYHVPRVWRLHGVLDVKALEGALADLIERHSTLRTSFRLQGSEVIQLIHPPAPFHLEPEPLADPNPDAVIEQWLEQEHSTPFDLASGRLIRARLLAIDHQHHVLLVNHHHIASDGWSLSVMARDLSELYNAHRTGRASALVPLPVHYHDYAAWQQQRLSGDHLQTLQGYWISQLTDLEPLELPADHPRPATPSHQEGSLGFQITPELLVPFEELCRLEGVTLQMGLLALVALLLHRYSRQDDFAIGVPIWGRNHPDLEPLIGVFINTLPIRTRFSTDLSFRQLLAQVKSTSIAAYDHQELTFEQMVEALQPDRDTSRNPLLQVMLQLIELPPASLSNLDGLEVEQLSASSTSSKLDLSFYLRRSTNQGLQGSITYATDLFCTERIQRLSEHLLTLLASALQSPDAPAASLTLLPATERRLIESWQHGPSIEVPDLCVHQLFEQQVERTPDAIALIFEDHQLSYEQLNARANQLAHHLIDHGVGTEVIVAVCLERSVELIVSLLAILKAGGAYLPIPVHHPTSRLFSILANSGARLLLAGEDQAVSLSDADLTDISLLAISSIVCKGQPNSNPEIIRSSSNLAYVMSTSGSTGPPKCVAVDHAAIVNRCIVYPQVWGLDSHGRVLAQSELWTDNSLREWLLPLTCGASVALASKLQQQEPDLLLNLLRNRRCTHLAATPSRLSTLLAGNPLGPVTLTAGGERLSPWLSEQIQNAGAKRLMHSFGATETCLACTFYDVKIDTNKKGGDWIGLDVPVGKPIPNIVLHVLDEGGQACPIGVPGELYIGGDGLARGYLNDPVLTAEKFMPDPFSVDSSARLYKSGDLVSWNPDGTLAFHGRIDHQIKVRGFRIEPGEIEANLLAHPDVAQVAVILRHDDPSNPRLIAYWVAETSRPKSAVASSEQLRAFLADRLPGYMVPAAFLELEALPLTPNGKLDRKALPAPSFSGSLEQRVEPSTDLERQLHGIWAEVLGHSDFGINDNFFAIGGHSLLTMSMGQLVRNRLDLVVPTYLYFSHPTIRELACKLLDSDSSSAPGAATDPGRERGIVANVLPPPVERALAQQRVFLERWPGQLAAGHQFIRLLGERESVHRLFWCFQGSNEHESLARYLAPEVSVYGMRSLHGTSDAKVIYRTPALLANLAGLYAREVMDLSGASAPLVVGGNCQAAWVGHAVAQQLVGCGYTVSRLLLMELRMQELQTPRLEWDRPVTLIWGKDSHHNPFSVAYRPASRRLRMLKKLAFPVYRALVRTRLQRVFSGGVDIRIVPGVHGAFFRSENIEGLAEVVKACVIASAASKGLGL